MIYHSHDVAQEWASADPPYRLLPEWRCAVHDEKDDIVAIAVCPDADAAIAFARRIAEALNRAEDVTP